jgi:hypothetical protein
MSSDDNEWDQVNYEVLADMDPKENSAAMLALKETSDDCTA